MTKKYRGWWLFPGLLFATLLQNSYDLYAIISGNSLALYRYDGPIILKLGKDLLYLMLFLSVLHTAILTKKIYLSDFAMTILVCLFFLFLCSALINGLFIATIGLRWAIPLVLFLVLHNWASTLNVDSARSWLLCGLFICLFAQIFQLFYMPPVFGEVLPGIPARTPGIFMAPNSAAFFGCACAACIMAFSNSKKSTTGCAVIVATLISMLAQSGTGMITSFILIALWLLDRQRLYFWVLSAIIFATALFNLNTLTQREADYMKLSGGGRIEVLMDISSTSFANFTNFGIYTNAANLISEDPSQATAVDSMLASWIGNFGILALPMFLLIILVTLMRMRDTDWKRALPCTIVLVLFSMTTVVLEAFPMNIVLILGILSSKKVFFQFNTKQNLL